MTASSLAPIRIGPEDWPADRDTLGWSIIDWQLDHLQQPDGPDRRAWRMTDEQLRFFLWWYAVDEHGRFAYRRGVLRRMKGWG